MGRKRRKTLDQVKEEKERKARRKELLRSLNSNKLDDTIKSKLTSSASIGVKRKKRKLGPVALVIHSKEEDDSILQSPCKFGPKSDIIKTTEYKDLNHSVDWETESVEVPAKPVSAKEVSFAKFEAWLNLNKLENYSSETLSINRSPSIMEQKAKLPVSKMEQEIMEALIHHPITIICAETASGKTTQVPQFLIEHGFGNKSNSNPIRRGRIGVTQPRRVATVNMAKRVAMELNTKLIFKKNDLNEKKGIVGIENGIVGYQMRYDTKSYHKEVNRLCFLTDGVLLRQAREDILLREYSVIIIDEAHERNLNTDLLLGLLSRIVILRAKLFLNGDNVTPLRVIIMSATLKVEDFTTNKFLFDTNFETNFYKDFYSRVQKDASISSSMKEKIATIMFNERELRLIDMGYVLKNRFPSELMPKTMVDEEIVCLKPFVVDVEKAREFKSRVVSHFSRKTEVIDYVKAAYKKVLSIHRKLPKGGILVFLTGQQEIHRLVQLLQSEKERVKKKKMDLLIEEEVDFSDIESEEEEEDVEEDIKLEMESSKKWSLLDIDFESNILESRALQEEKQAEPNTELKPVNPDDGEFLLLKAVPLYARLNVEQQRKVFEKVDEEKERLIVVATNVAETSLTIPGIRYVVDSGRQKVKEFEQTTGLSRFEIKWTSKASAEQRAGRSGRDTLEGHCYRLYSSAVFENYFPKFSSPEIERTDIDHVALYMKRIGIDDIKNFPFPSPPKMDSLIAAETRLNVLKAIKDGKITELGETISEYPVRPRYGKMIAISGNNRNISKNSLVLAIALVATLCFQEPFLDHNSDMSKKEITEAKARFRDTSGDQFKVLNAFGAFYFKFFSPNSGKVIASEVAEFCKSNMLHRKTMEQMIKLFKQLCTLVSRYQCKVDAILLPPTQSDLAFLKQLLCSANIDRVARKLPHAHGLLIRKQFTDLIRSKDSINSKKEFRLWPYEVGNSLFKQVVFISPKSIFHSKSYNSLPDYVIFEEVFSKPMFKSIIEVEEGSENRILNQNQERRIKVIEQANESALDNESVLYLNKVTDLDEHWLIFLSKDTNLCKIIFGSEVRFNKDIGEIEALVSATFSSKQWLLQKQWISLQHLSTVVRIEDKVQIVAGKVLLKAIIQGSIPVYSKKCPRDMKSKLAFPISYITQTGSEKNYRIESFLDLFDGAYTLQAVEDILNLKRAKFVAVMLELVVASYQIRLKSFLNRD